MADLFRDSPVGQIIQFITKNKFLEYYEENDGFQCPNSYARHPTPIADFKVELGPSSVEPF